MILFEDCFEEAQINKVFFLKAHNNLQSQSRMIKKLKYKQPENQSSQLKQHISSIIDMSGQTQKYKITLQARVSYQNNLFQKFSSISLKQNTKMITYQSLMMMLIFLYQAKQKLSLKNLTESLENRIIRNTFQFAFRKYYLTPKKQLNIVTMFVKDLVENGYEANLEQLIQNNQFDEAIKILQKIGAANKKLYQITKIDYNCEDLNLNNTKFIQQYEWLLFFSIKNMNYNFGKGLLKVKLQMLNKFYGIEIALLDQKNKKQCLILKQYDTAQFWKEKNIYKVRNRISQIYGIIEAKPTQTNLSETLYLEQQFNEEIQENIENRDEVIMTLDYFLGSNSEFLKKMRIYFIQDIIEQLLQYKSMTSEELPLLNPLNICYNTKIHKFFIKIDSLIPVWMGTDPTKICLQEFDPQKPYLQKIKKLCKDRIEAEKIAPKLKYFSFFSSLRDKFLLLLDYYDAHLNESQITEIKTQFQNYENDQELREYAENRIVRITRSTIQEVIEQGIKDSNSQINLIKINAKLGYKSFVTQHHHHPQQINSFSLKIIQIIEQFIGQIKYIAQQRQKLTYNLHKCLSALKIMHYCILFIFAKKLKIRKLMLKTIQKQKAKINLKDDLKLKKKIREFNIEIIEEEIIPYCQYLVRRSASLEECEKFDQKNYYMIDFEYILRKMNKNFRALLWETQDEKSQKKLIQSLHNFNFYVTEANCEYLKHSFLSQNFKDLLKNKKVFDEYLNKVDKYGQLMRQNGLFNDE